MHRDDRGFLILREYLYLFEQLNIHQDIDHEAYQEQTKALISDLVAMQYQFADHPGPLIIILAGFWGAGVENLVNFIARNIDMKQAQVTTFWENTFDQGRPYYYRFWDNLPPKGKTTIFLDAYYMDFIKSFVKGEINALQFKHYLLEIKEFETMLARDNAVLLKCWFYIDKARQKRQIKKAGDQLTLPDDDALESASWNYKNYEKIYYAAEQAIMLTDSAPARWHLIAAHKQKMARLKTLKLVHGIYQIHSSHIDTGYRENEIYINETSPVLDDVDLTRTISKTAYKDRSHALQQEIYELAWLAHREGLSTVLVFEGWDAAGKGGCIRRLTNAIDTRLVHIYPIAAPSEVERQFHYLWRFWRKLPRKGFISVFDRSWYGRVLVERVENFARLDEWLRAYEEINHFEQQLLHDRMIILKFWLHISRDVQLERFQEREKLPWKQHKITTEDWRNREKWDAYEESANEMLTRTSTSHAPWIIIPANDKHYARIEILNHFQRALKDSLEIHADRTQK